MRDMKVLNFLNSQVIGNTRNIYASYFKQQQAYTPNLDSIILRLACQEKDVYESIGVTGLVPPFASKFRRDKYLDLLAVANEDGKVMLIDTSKDDDNVKSFRAHQNAICDICWLSDKCHLITVSSDHIACVWDMNTLQNIGSFERHTESIKSVDVSPNDAEIFATGSRDGTICVWDMRDKNYKYGNTGGKPPIRIQSAHCRKVANRSKFPFNKKLSSSVSAVAYQNSFNLASTGSTDSVVKIWDMRKTYICKPTYIPAPRYQMKYKDNKSHGYGYTSLVFDSIYKKLYASSTANKILMFDCHAYADAETVYDGFKCNTYYIKLALSFDDQYLACGSSSNKAYVWKTNQPGHPKWEFPGHASEVTTVAWGSQEVSKLVTCGDDNKILIWKTINHDNIQEVGKSLFTASKFKLRTSSTSSGLSDSSSPLSITQNCSPNQNKTPVVKTITSFYQPLSSPDDLSLDFITTLNSSNQSPNVASQAQVISSSKENNPNIRQSPDSSIPASKSQEKENLLGSSRHSSIRQMKRKLHSKSTPEIQRKFKRRKQNNSNVKKQSNSNDIRNYFTSSLSPKE